MKKDLHPAYYQTGVTCACGNTFTIGSTMAKPIRVEVCYACHPFYTGKQKIIDSTGRVDRFKKRFQTAKDMEAKHKEETAAKLAKKSGMAEEEPAAPVAIAELEEQLVEIPEAVEAKPVSTKAKAKSPPAAKKPVKKEMVKKALALRAEGSGATVAKKATKPAAKKPAVKKAVKKPVTKKVPAKKPVAKKKK